MNVRRLHIAAGLTLLIAAVFTATANADDAIRFQRVMAPADRVQDWPIGREKYLPMDTAEFERLIDSLSPSRADAPAPPGAAVVAAAYEARLVGDALRGRAVAEVVLSGSKPARLCLDPCNIAFGRAVWDPPAQAASDKTPRPALSGLTDHGAIETLVERSGRLRFDWSLAGRRDSANVLGFSFELPSAAARSLSLELPKQFTPSLSEGLVVGSQPAGKGWTRWQIELGGSRRFRLRLLPLGAIGRRPQLALLRESRTYDFSPRGLEVSAQWRLQAYNVPLQQITVLLDPGLELISARYGDAPLSWSAVRLPDESVKIVLTLSEPVNDVERVIRLGAVSRPTYDRLWRLPRIRAEGLVWQEGSLALTVVEPLVINHVAPIGCAQTGASSLSSPRVGESFQFQAFDPDATIDVTLSHRPSALEAVSATAMDLSDEEAVARMTADFRSTEAARFSLEADLARRWRIDAVRSKPSGAVADWNLERRADGGQRLRIRLSESLSSEKPLRLKITARRLFAPRLEQLVGDDLPPLRFRDLTDEKRLVAVRTAGANAVRLSGDERLNRMDLARLSPAERELFAEPPGDLLFESNEASEPLMVSLVGQKPNYDAAVDVDVAVGAVAIRETCRIRCTVVSGRVDRVPVLFFPRREGPVQWSLDGDATDRGVSARRWSAAELSAAGWDASLEVWELSFAKPQSGTFELTARRQTPWNGRQPATVLLAALPEASHQRGSLELSSLDATRLNVDNRRLAPRLPTVPATDRSSSARLAYRYDPLRDTVDGTSAAVRVLDSRESDSANAWIWESRLESWFPPCGVARHRAAYDVQNAGRKSLRLVMPSGVRRDDLRRVSIDGDPATWQWTDGRLTVALPAGSKFLSLIVHWTAAADPLGRVAALSPSLPEPDVPTLRRRWTAWAPPGYENIRWSQTPLPLGEANGQEMDSPGWTAWRFDLPPEAPVVLRVIHTDSMWLASAVALMLAAALSCWKGVARPVAWIALLLGFSTAVLVLPDAYATIALGGLLGTLVGMAWRWTRRRQAAADPSSVLRNSGNTVTMALPIKIALAAVALMPFSGSLFAAESTKPYRVLVPIDAQKKPVGDKVFVPEPLYQTLYRHAATPEKSQGWLIVRATYRGDLTSDAVAQRWTVDALRAQYQLHVFGHATRVRIPLCSRGGSLLPDGVLLDGRPIEPQWEPDTGLLAFDVAEPGDYRLDVSLRPTPLGSGRSSGFDVAVPRVPMGQFELSLPDNAPSIEVTSACGAVRFEKKPLRMIAELGPADRLAVRWSDNAPPSGPAVDVEQYVWLRLQPGSVVAAVKFRLRVLEGQLQQLRLSVDPRLRLLPLSGDDPPTVHAGPETGQSRLITLHLPRPVADRTALEATFLLSGATGVGNFRLPRIEVIDARYTKRWMAVSVDPALDHDEPAASPLETVTASDFLKAWGSASAKPYAAYRLPSGEVDWTVSTRPHEPRSQLAQVVTLSFDRRRVDLGLDAQVTTASGYLFQYRLAAPVGLHIEDVSLREGDVERAGRWAQDPDGVITVFLNSAASGQQRLTLRGWMPVSPGTPTALPRIRIQQCERRDSVVRVFQRPGASVVLRGGSKQSGAGPTPSETARTDLGQFLGAFADNGSKSPDVTVTVERERPQPDAKPTSNGPPMAARSQAAQSDPRPDAPDRHRGCVRLADQTMVLRSDGGVYGTSLFDIEPNGADQCPLNLPKGYDLVQASVEGTRVSPHKSSGGDWRLPLVSQQLPQRIEVVFRCEPTEAIPVRRRELSSPTLGDWSVRQTLWTVIGPSSWTIQRSDNAPTVRPWRQIYIRMNNEAAMLRAAAASDDLDQSRPSCRAWMRRLAVSLAALREQQAGDRDPGLAGARREADLVERNVQQTIQRLQIAKSESQTAEESWTDGPTETLHHAASSALYCSMAGRVDRLTLDGRPIGRGGWIHRLDAIVAWLVLAGLVVVVLASWRRRTRLAKLSQVQ
ncbi:MAG: hypothetical protein ABFC77_12165 [Thermoguttaceae bacterium]